MPLLETRGQQKLITGKDVVHFTWDEGVSPYTIRVKRKGTRQKVTQTVRTREIALNLALKTDAPYRVTVRDGRGDEVCTSFKVVANLPSKPTTTELWEIQNDPQGQPYGCARWLAKQNQNRWAFEAYQFLKNGGRDQKILSLCGID